jgi:hypothetical protein
MDQNFLKCTDISAGTSEGTDTLGRTFQADMWGGMDMWASTSPFPLPIPQPSIQSKVHFNISIMHYDTHILGREPRSPKAENHTKFEMENHVAQKGPIVLEFKAEKGREPKERSVREQGQLPISPRQTIIVG